MTQKTNTSQKRDKARHAAEPTDVASPQTAAETDAAFAIVGIGASAGGLAAFEAFFAGMPESVESGMAFVLVQHLAPDHKSILRDLLERHTRMQVYQVTDGMEVQPNCAYIIPPNRDMTLVKGKLCLVEPSAQRGVRLPIDIFFRSLAQDQHQRAICIVLSGTGSDGTLGVRAVKGEGGMAMVQTPESADYDGMPRSAIDTGLVDYVLPPAEMLPKLIAYAKYAFGMRMRQREPAPTKSDNVMQNIFILLHGQTGHDFSLYKENTIDRRIERRMSLHQIDQIDKYLRYLQENSNEVEALFRDLLIGVTKFFRDEDAFTVIAEQAIPRLFEGKPPGATVRVWVPGCSTGEEAYSLAILIQEHLDELKQPYKVQIFATDIDSRAVQATRAGVYPASISADISHDRLARFFVGDPDDSTYRIQKSIREMLIVSEHDIIQSPPFSRLDLISCRNVLIYMGAELHRKVIPLFHYALNPAGLLFLGTSETVSNFVNLFTAIDRKWKLYQRLEDTSGRQRPPLGQFLPPMTSHMTGRGAIHPPVSNVPLTDKLPVRKLTERVLLEEYVPVSVLVNPQGEILYIHGRTGNFLEPAAGEAGLNIISMAREGLDQALASGLHKAATQATPVYYPGLRVRSNGHFTLVNLTVRPVQVDAESTEATLFLVVLERAAQAELAAPTEETEAASAESPRTAEAQQIAALKEDLRVKEEYLQTTLEEMETANEELRSTNEELQSVNEEVQSTNEELETSREELQSVNEELATVNAELQQKVVDLSKANDDMNNLLAGTGVGTIFVDNQLNIRRFTPSATRLINLIQSDIGRPVGHIVTNWAGYDRLVADVENVLDTLIPHEIEVQTHAGAWYLLSIRPYRTLGNVIEGAVITFVDITRIKRAEAIQRLATVVRDAYDAVMVHALDGRILAWNPSAERMYGWNEDEALAMNIEALVPESLSTEAKTTIQKLSTSQTLSPYRTQRLTKEGRVLDVWLTATALVNESGEVYAISTTEHEVDA